jgi:uncharacterized protein YdaU (DUF1376 family)
MSGRPWYKRCGADFIEGTMGLSLEEKGAYSLCLDLIYSYGGPIADDPRWIAGVCGVSLRKWAALRERLIATGKLISVDGRLRNVRADKELIISEKTPRKVDETSVKGQRNVAENAPASNENNGLECSIREDKIRAEKKEKPTGFSAKRGSRLPDDWMPDEVFARSEGLSASEAVREGEKFRDYWNGQPGQKGVKLDWQATWKNWVRKAADDRPGKSARKPSDWRNEPEYRGVR